MSDLADAEINPLRRDELSQGRAVWFTVLSSENWLRSLQATLNDVSDDELYILGSQLGLLQVFVQGQLSQRGLTERELDEA